MELFFFKRSILEKWLSGRFPNSSRARWAQEPFDQAINQANICNPIPDTFLVFQAGRVGASVLPW